MTLEADILTAIDSIFAQRVFPDVAPLGTPTPYATFQVVGGQAVNFMESVAPGKRNGRVQFKVWAMTRAEASIKQRALEDAVVSSTALRGYVLGHAISIHEEDTNLYGTQQDISIWY